MSNRFKQSKNNSNIIDRLGISKEHYLSLMESVKDVFPQEWVAKELKKHDRRRYPPTMHCDLLPRFLHPLQCNPIPMLLGLEGSCVPLIRLGQLIQAVEGKPPEKLVQRLRGDPGTYMGALFELEVIEVFKKSGFSLVKPLEADGVDFTFEKNSKNVFVEASHKRASDFFLKVDDIFHRSFIRDFSTNAKRLICLKLKKCKASYYTDDVMEEIVGNVVNIGRGFSDRFEDQEGIYYISQKKSEKSGLEIRWHDQGKECVYEAKVLFKTKLEEKEKQLENNPGSYCAVDMRAHMPYILAKKNNDFFNVSSEILGDWLSDSCSFFNKKTDNKKLDVGGIFIWVTHVGRVKDLIVDQMDQNEIIFINAPGHLSEEEALQLFPFVKVPEDLSWYNANQI